MKGGGAVYFICYTMILSNSHDLATIVHPHKLDNNMFLEKDCN